MNNCYRRNDKLHATCCPGGWTTCPRSGVAYHPAYDVGCGHCKPCLDAAKAVADYKRERGAA